MNGVVRFQNIDISYFLVGKGPTIVWLHGFLEDKSIWKSQLEFFKLHFTNICIDLLGHGKTANVAQEHSMELQADAVLTVLNELHIDSFMLVGHSMGGYVSLAILEKEKKRVCKIVLLNSTSNPDTSEKIINRKRLLKIIPEQKDTYARLGVVNLFSSDSNVSTKEIENLVQIAKGTSVQGICASLVGMMNRKSRLELFREFRGEKLIIAGEKDMVLSSKLSKVESIFTEAQFEILPGGHMSYLEAEEQLNALFALFFRVDKC